MLVKHEGQIKKKQVEIYQRILNPFSFSLDFQSYILQYLADNKSIS